MVAQSRQLVSIFLSLLLLAATAQSTPACGPFLPEAVFSSLSEPDQPQDRYAGGELGVISKSFARRYLFVAYRYLTKTPLTAQERTAFGDGNPDVDVPETAAQSWLTARKTVPGASPIAEITVYRSISPGVGYDTYLNCQADAFKNASKILAQRIQTYGKDSAIVKDWLKAQDLVFCHCAAPEYDYKTKKAAPEPGFPQPAATNDDALCQADRAYQLAAAHFYAQDFDQARKEFLAIAADQKSPYHQLAPYLVARCDIRKGCLQNSANTELLSQAKRELLDLANNESTAALIKRLCHDLVDYLDAQIAPGERLSALAQNLLKPNSNKAKFQQELTDYTSILDKFLEDDNGDQTKKEFTSIPANGRTDLTDWIVCLQSSAAGGKEEVGQRWQSTHSDLWLVPCLTSAAVTDANCDQLVKAASAVDPSSPAYLTIKYHLIRLLIAKKQIDAARSELEKILQNSGKMSPSTRNLFFRQKSEVATRFDEYWQDVLQVTASDDCPDDPDASNSVKKHAPSNQYSHGSTCFTEDGATVLNTSIPLRLLVTAATSAHLDKNVKRDYLQALWTRAVMLGDWKVATQLTPLLAATAPPLATSLANFTKASTVEEKHFILSCLALQNPAMRPYLTAGVQRSTAFNKIDDYHDNWWCAGGISDLGAQDSTNKAPKPKKMTFLTDKDAADAGAEFHRLRALGPGPDYLLAQVMDWSAKHPKDARLPQALYHAIRSPKFGCGGKLAGNLSKRAFGILHKNFPGNPYTLKTQFWYGS